MLALLIHYIGDSAQPLHASTRVSETFPFGDKGGNSFALRYHYRVNELHSLYDTALYTLANPIDIAQFARNISLKYSKTITNADLVFEPSKWVSESHELAGPLYVNISEHSLPSDTYLDLHKKTIERQLVLAGMRLSQVLGSICAKYAGFLA